MESKKWLKSKTLWVNLVFIIGLLLNAKWGIEVDAETQAILATGILAIVNIILRVKTNTALTK